MTAPNKPIAGVAPVPRVLLRHGPTAWNAAGRIQGHSDRPLSPAGRARVRGWRLPDTLAGYRWVTSPLRRARETAALLGYGDAGIEPALMETDWGAWEGRTLGALRAELGDAMAVMEARGLDFRPPDGESPRQVQARLAPWLRRLADEAQPTVAVCHKGVIRALYALATGWDMRAKPREKLRDDGLHSFRVEAGGGLSADRINWPLIP